MAEEQMYIEYRDNKPVAYAYGEKWVAMALYMGDMRYDTPEKAKEAWDKIKGREISI